MMQCENCCFRDDKENLCINENAMFNIDDECLSRIDNDDYNAIYNKALGDMISIIKEMRETAQFMMKTDYEYACDRFIEQAEQLLK